MTWEYTGYLASNKSSYSTILASSPPRLPVESVATGNSTETTGTFPAPLLAIVVADDFLNVRSCPSKIKCPLPLGWLARGEQIEVFECSDGWAKIGAEAWVFANYLAPNHCEVK